MGLREWNDRVNERWSQQMTYMEASFAKPPSIFSEFMKSSKKPDTRVGIFITGYATGVLLVAAQNAIMHRNSLGLAAFLTVLAVSPVSYHTWRGKRILAAQPQPPQA